MIRSEDWRWVYLIHCVCAPVEMGGTVRKAALSVFDVENGKKKITD